MRFVRHSVKKWLPQSLLNSRGMVILSTIVLISVMVVIMAGVASLQVLAVAKESYRVNEAFRYLNIMEEMGQVVGRARLLGKVYDTAGTACPAGTTLYTVSSISFCLPAATPGAVCVTRTDTGLTESFCVYDFTIITKNIEDPDGESLIADFKVRKIEDKSFFTRALETVASNLITIAQSAATVYSAPPGCGYPTGDYRCATGTGSPDPSTAPPALSGNPGAAATEGTSSTTLDSGYHSNESWFPAAAWAYTTEIRTPACDNSAHMWLGCMRCSQTGVNCIQIRMCPPKLPSCTTGHYVQRIAVY